MREKAISVPPTIALGEGCVVLSRLGYSRKVIANVLGTETNPDTGLRTMWLDRMIHRSDEAVVAQGEKKWSTSGAISTILSEQAA